MGWQVEGEECDSTDAPECERRAATDHDDRSASAALIAREGSVQVREADHPFPHGLGAPQANLEEDVQQTQTGSSDPRGHGRWVPRRQAVTHRLRQECGRSPDGESRRRRAPLLGRASRRRAEERTFPTDTRPVDASHRLGVGDGAGVAKPDAGVPYLEAGQGGSGAWAAGALETHHLWRLGIFVNRRVRAALSASGRRTGFRARSDAPRSRADLAGNGQVNALALSASYSSRLMVPSSNSFFALSISLAAPPEPAVVRTYSSNCACAAAASR